MGMRIVNVAKVVKLGEAKLGRFYIPFDGPNRELLLFQKCASGHVKINTQTGELTYTPSAIEYGNFQLQEVEVVSINMEVRTK